MRNFCQTEEDGVHSREGKSLCKVTEVGSRMALSSSDHGSPSGHIESHEAPAPNSTGISRANLVELHWTITNKVTLSLRTKKLLLQQCPPTLLPWMWEVYIITKATLQKLFSLITNPCPVSSLELRLFRDPPPFTGSLRNSLPKLLPHFSTGEHLQISSRNQKLNMILL